MEYDGITWDDAVENKDLLVSSMESGDLAKGLSDVVNSIGENGGKLDMMNNPVYFSQNRRSFP